MEVKLSSCPFCGSDDIDPSFVRGYQAGNLSQPIIAAGCMDCGASGKSVNVPDHSTGYAEATEAWNTRALSDLEIVQKALGPEQCIIFGNNCIGFKDLLSGGSQRFDSIESLLTWAKQTVGYDRCPSHESEQP